MLTIQMPQALRNWVNALVRGHPDFEAFRLANGGFQSRDMTKEQTLKAVEQFGLESDVLAMADEMEKRAMEKGFNAAEDSRVESKLAGAAKPFAETARRFETGELDASAMAASVLDPLRPFLAPTLLDTVATALAPIVAEACKPPVVKTVSLDASGHEIEIICNDANRVGASTLGKLFGLSRSKHSGVHISVWDCSDSPAIDPFFVPEPTMLAKIVSAIDPVPGFRKPRNVWLAGPAGTGKTSLPEQIAARSKRPYVRIAFQRAIEPTDLLGMLGLDGKGGMAWRDGVLTKAIRKPGTIILLDEITFAPAGLCAVLQTLLDTRNLTLPTGEVVRCAEGVVFCAADNTRGFGDETGVYAGTMQANAALVDRMARLIPVDYLPVELESQALANHTGAAKAACRRVVDFVNSARKLAGFDARPLSLRRMVAFIEMVSDGFGVSESFDDTALSRLPDAERETLRMHIKAAFDDKAFMVELNGTAPETIQPGASDLPEQAKAKSIFDSIDQDS
jgi:cobaltochelatase CobS